MNIPSQISVRTPLGRLPCCRLGDARHLAHLVWSKYGVQLGAFGRSALQTTKPLALTLVLMKNGLSEGASIQSLKGTVVTFYNQRSFLPLSQWDQYAWSLSSSHPLKGASRLNGGGRMLESAPLSGQPTIADSLLWGWHLMDSLYEFALAQYNKVERRHMFAHLAVDLAVLAERIFFPISPPSGCPMRPSNNNGESLTFRVGHSKRSQLSVILTILQP